MRPEVSIIMPVLNGQKYIAEALESIAAQTFQNFELIVVNDGSTDRTCEILDTFKTRFDLKVIHHPACQGVPRAMNDGLRAASGRFISFLDHDDGWFPEFLQTQYNYLQQHPEVGMVHSDFQTIDGAGKVLEASVAICRNRTRPSGHVFQQLFLDSFIVGNSVMVRKECFDRVGLVDEELRWGDYHLWMRIARQFKIDYVPQVLTIYRQHSGQETRSAGADEAFVEPVATASLIKILEAYPEIRQELGGTIVRRRLASVYFDAAYGSYRAGGHRRARAFLAKAIRLWPSNSRYLMLWAATLLDPGRAEALRRAWHRVRGAEASADVTASIH